MKRKICLQKETPWTTEMSHKATRKPPDISNELLADQGETN